MLASVLVGCAVPTSSASATYESDRDESTPTPTPTTEKELTSATIDAGPTTASGSVDVSNTDSEPDAAAPKVTAQALLAKLQGCAKVSSSAYARDVGGTANIDVCGLTNAVFWKADMDIDCDGKSSAVCNASADPSYQSQTAATDSMGASLDAAKLPYVVVPGVSSRWSYKAAGVAMGSVALVIYDGKMEFGIVGDVGPTSIIGEASHAMAKPLGINPDPSIGGASSGVVYVVFTGSSSIVKKKEDHAEAVSLGTKLAQKLLDQN